jgi:hypothetical protein
MKNYTDENNYPLFDGILNLKQKPLNSYQKLKKQIKQLKEHKLTLKQCLVSVCLNPNSPVSISIINHHKNKYKSVDEVFE